MIRRSATFVKALEAAIPQLAAKGFEAASVQITDDADRLADELQKLMCAQASKVQSVYFAMSLKHLNGADLLGVSFRIDPSLGASSTV